LNNKFLISNSSEFDLRLGALPALIRAGFDQLPLERRQASVAKPARIVTITSSGRVTGATAAEQAAVELAAESAGELVGAIGNGIGLVAVAGGLIYQGIKSSREQQAHIRPTAPNSCSNALG
jgi:hypothetical protein